MPNIEQTDATIERIVERVKTQLHRAKSTTNFWGVYSLEVPWQGDKIGHWKDSLEQSHK